MVITYGGRPMLAAAGEQRHGQRVPSVPVVDAVGAGDALAEAYLAVRVRAGRVEKALGAGIAASSRSVRARGCAVSHPDASRVAGAASRLEVPA